MGEREFTTVVAIDRRSVEQLRQVWPTWRRFKPDIFCRPMLVIYDWDGTEAHAGTYPPIISKELYDRCQARLQGLSRGQRVDLCR